MPISSTVIITETERKEAELKNGQRKLSLKYPSLLKEGVDFEGDSHLIPSKKRLYSDDIPMGDVWKQQKEAIASGHDDGGKGGDKIVFKATIQRKISPGWPNPEGREHSPCAR